MGLSRSLRKVPRSDPVAATVRRSGFLTAKGTRMQDDPVAIASTVFFSLFDDGTIGCSDGVGCVGGLEREEVLEFVKKAAVFFGLIGDDE